MKYRHQAPRNQHGFEREQRGMEVQTTGLHRRSRSRNRWCFGRVQGAKLNAHTLYTPCTHQPPNVGNRIIDFTNSTLWANVLGSFSQVPAGRRLLDNGETPSRTSLAQASGSSLLESVGVRSVTDALKLSNSLLH